MIGLSLLFLLLVSPAWATVVTVGPSDCAAATVNTAIGTAVDGDTVELTCSGTVSWTATVVIPDTKGITLKGPGSYTNTTTESFPLTITSNQDPAIDVSVTSGNSLTRITGFKFTNSIASTKGIVYLEGCGTESYRIDNNRFDSVQLPHADLEGTITVTGRGAPTSCYSTGLIDSNHFYDASYTDGYAIFVAEFYRYPLDTVFDYAGGNAWSRSFSFGSSDFVFIENNYFQNVSQYTRHLIAGHNGAKYIFRYNTMDTDASGSPDLIDAHGWCLDNIGEGTRGGEIYQNTFDGANVGRDMVLRGGAWLVYDNTFLHAADMQLFEYRADSGICTQCAADGAIASHPSWDQCVPTDGSSYPLKQQIGADMDGNSSPSYFWNNLFSGSNQSPTVNDFSGAGSQANYIQLNRDYFVSTSKPAALASYSAYTYPHPLRGGGGSLAFFLRSLPWMEWLAAVGIAWHFRAALVAGVILISLGSMNAGMTLLTWTKQTTMTVTRTLVEKVKR